MSCVKTATVGDQWLVSFAKAHSDLQKKQVGTNVGESDKVAHYGFILAVFSAKKGNHEISYDCTCEALQSWQMITK